MFKNWLWWLHNSVNVQKIIEFYTLKELITWYVNYISITCRHILFYFNTLTTGKYNSGNYSKITIIKNKQTPSLWHTTYPLGAIQSKGKEIPPEWLIVPCKKYSLIRGLGIIWRYWGIFK